MFATGNDTIPPLGFDDPSHITVSEGHHTLFPIANTCPMELELPGIHTTFDKFRSYMNQALDLECTGFGIV